ncbi:hypothetical protein JDV02_006163 [Purpureocillium takamizusanense]|uniref:Uncharacterized protein n=1 Tax=Purpureocillium takamizusanense TaxID=2060973 RepID=A0A9Q8QK30_9HYPO|nr:uncharacterized protein JDV02_006163 [Purpureocillium takamizusanense]UNI20032.1 hypothetical protein JDV02_006163 [Purpureocillium takamizusanense]
MCPGNPPDLRALPLSYRPFGLMPTAAAAAAGLAATMNSHHHHHHHHQHHRHRQSLPTRWLTHPLATLFPFPQAGLSAILGEPSSSPAPNPQGSPADIATHARVFYYAQRIGVQIDFAQYQRWLADHPDHQPPHVVPPGYLSSQQDSADSAAAGETTTSPASPPPTLSWQQAAPKADLYVDRSAVPASQSAPGGAGEPNYPMGFAEMLKLLQEGKPIPGIRQIPNTLARDPGVKPVGSRAAPKKPWERDEVIAPPDMDLPHSLDTEFPPLESDTPEAQTEAVAS